MVPNQLSLQKCDQILARAVEAHEDGQKSIRLSTKELIMLLKYIRSLHNTMRDVQLDLIQATFKSKHPSAQKALEEALTRIENKLGPVETLFEEMSEVEVSEFSDVEDDG